MQTPRTHRISVSTLLFVCLGLVSTATLAQNIPGFVPIVIQSNNYVGPVEWAQDRAGAPASNGTINLQSATGAGTAPSSVNARGANLQVNGNTVAQPSAMVMQAQAVCTASTMNWSVITSCSGDIPQRLAGQTAVATDSTAPGTGSATYTCGANGSWSAPASATCTSTCGATTGSWTVGAATCSAALAARTSGQTYLATDSGAPSTGSANFSCSAAGTWSLVPGYNCASQPPLGSLSSDSFLWAIGRTQGGDGYEETISSARLYELVYAYNVAGDLVGGDLFNVGPLTAHGSYFRVPRYTYGGYISTYYNLGGIGAYVSGVGYVTYYPSECQSQTQYLKGYYASSYPNPSQTYPIPGVVCRKGYTP